MPTSDMFADDEVADRSTGRRMRRRLPGLRNTFRQFCDLERIPPLQAIPSDWCRGPFFLDYTLPTSAAFTSLLTDDAIYGDEHLRSVYSPTDGGSNKTQSVGFVVTGALLVLTQGAANVQDATVLDDLLAARPAFEWTVGGVTRSRSLVESIKLQAETSNVVDQDQNTPTAFVSRFAAIPLRLPTMYIIGKAGDEMGVRTSAALTATLTTRVKLFGAALPADVLSDIVGSSRQSQGGACNANASFGVDLGRALSGPELDLLATANADADAALLASVAAAN